MEFLLQPGDMIFINNLTVLHARSGFENDPDPAKKRLLLRLWLATPDGRVTPPGNRFGRETKHSGLGGMQRVVYCGGW